MIYGIIKVELDDFSALNTKWVPDVESILLFRSESIRDIVLSLLREECESYEDYIPFEKTFTERIRDEKGRFLRGYHESKQER